MTETLENIILRLGLIAAAAVCWFSASRLWEAGNMVIERGALALALLCFFTAAVLLFCAVVKHPPRRADWLIAAAVCLMWLSFLHVQNVNRDQAGRVYTTDVQLFSDYGAALTRMGENPYAYDMLESYRIYRASRLYSTPIINGDVVGGFSYPALGFLLYVPFQALGIDTTLIFPAALLITLMVIFIAAPRPLRPLAVLPFLVNPNYTLYSLGGVNDIVWALMLCIMILSWRRLWLAALIFGLACAYKQQPWFLAPFLLVKVWYETSGSSRARFFALVKFAAAAAGIFVIVNAYWIALDPQAWLLGVLRPLVDKMIILGQGYSSLTLFGVVMLPQWFFTAFTYGSLLLLLILYIRFFDHWREMLWIAPVVALWFGHRSLSSYWYFYLFPLVLALLMGWRRKDQAVEQSANVEPSSQSLLWLTPVGIGAAALIMAAIAAVTPNPLTIAVVGSVNVDGGNTRVTVQVENTSDSTITPRFSIQSWGEQPAFWEVLHGSQQIAPASVETYTIFSSAAAEMFNPAAGAQIIVSDADRYDFRASTLLPPAMLTYVDAIPNGEFVYWNGSGTTPYGWGLVGIPGSAALVTVDTLEYRGRAAQLSVPSAQSVALDTWLMMPEAPITLWVNPPLEANQAPGYEAQYGIEVIFTANNDRFLILFGTEESGLLPNGIPFYGIPAPSGVWTQQTLLLPDILSALNIDLPPPQIRAVGAVQFPMRMMNFRLFAAASGSQPLTAQFGAVTNVGGANSLADARITTYATNPAEVLRWRGQINLEAGNYERAVSYFESALALDPDQIDVRFELGEALYRNGTLEEARHLLESAAPEYPQSARLQTILGEVLLAQGDALGAQAAFNAALEAFTRDGIAYGDAAHARIYRGLGDSLAAQERYAVAESMYTRALGLDPLDSATYSGLLLTFTRQGQCDTAQAIARQAELLGLNINIIPCEGT